MDKDWRDFEREEKEMKDVEQAAMLSMVVEMKRGMDTMMAAAKEGPPGGGAGGEESVVEEVTKANEERERGEGGRSTMSDGRRKKIANIAKSFLPG